MYQEHTRRESAERLDLRLTERDLADFQRELSGLQPASRLDREELLFRAGQESMRRGPLGRHGRWFWPSSAGALALACTGLITALIVQGEPQIIHRTQYVNVYEPPEPTSLFASVRETTNGNMLSPPGPASPGNGIANNGAAAGVELLPMHYFQYRHSLATFGPPASEQFPRPAPNVETAPRNDDSPTYYDTLQGLLDSLHARP